MKISILFATFVFQTSILYGGINAFNLNVKKFDVMDASENTNTSQYHLKFGTDNYDYFSLVGYFNNLYLNQMNNTAGTCTFVSFSSILSYFDAYYNDSFIDSKFNIRQDLGYLLTAENLDSPGIKRINDYITTDLDYFNLCKSTKNDIFTSYLIVKYNEEWSPFPNDVNTIRIGNAGYEIILNNLYGKSNLNLYQEEDSSLSNEYYSNKIKSFIDQGLPVIVSIGSSNENVNIGHSVVAYSYDLNNIYANYGWGIDHTHRPLINELSNDGYNKINGYFAFNPSVIFSNDNYNLSYKYKNLSYNAALKKHVHKVDFYEINSIKHGYGCIEGDNIIYTEDHIFLANRDFKVCMKCGCKIYG